MEGISKRKFSSSPEDFQLAVLASPGHVYKGSNVLLARAHFNGTLELMTAAWERLLGYGREEFEGKTLCQLIGLGTPVATTAVAAILDELNPEPVDLKVRCRDGQGKCLRLHRRFDPYERAVYILAEETLQN
jgi:PAS domain-containing protein